MKTKTIILLASAAVLVIAAAVFFILRRPAENTDGAKSVPLPMKVAKPAPERERMASGEDAQQKQAARIEKAEAERAAYKAKREAEREKERADGEREQYERQKKARAEALPEELRYRNRPKMPADLEEKIEIRRMLKNLSMDERRHPERAEEFKVQRKMLEARLDELQNPSDKKKAISERQNKVVPVNKKEKQQ